MVQIAVPRICRNEKLRLLSVGYDADISPSAMKLLHRFIDRPRSLLWSSERLAKSIKRNVRTVERALAELRTIGVLTTVRRRRQTLVKALRPERISALGEAGAEAAKRACEAEISMLRRGVLTRQERRPISIIDIKKADERAPWRVQGAPTPSLLRSLNLLGDPRRR